MLIKHDFRCEKCDTFIENEMVESKTIIDHKATTLKCPKCRKVGTCYVTWESGEAPKGRMKQEFVGDIWDKHNVDYMSPEYNKRVNEDIRKKRKNA